MKSIVPDPTHRMGKWESGVVVIISEPRFGRERRCVRCGAEQAETVSGTRHDESLERKCSMYRKRRKP